MPIQTPQWTDFLICTICCNEYDHLHNPVSLGCGHTLCKLCLSKLQRKQCPYDQTVITIDINDLPVNYALLQLVSSSCFNTADKNQAQLKLQTSINMPTDDFHLYSKAQKHIEDVALYLKPFSPAANSCGSVNVLSRPMQRKLVMLVNCQLLEEEGRVRALKAARSLGERTVTELIIQHQNPQQLSTNLWAAVRARGCQFLGPAMQEEVLKLVLLALEDGSALSRKVLVMFVVQRLEPHFPQASKTSIGHVVQLLYRASCFVVSKREGDSSLMKLKEEFRTYDALRREHDAQIVEIATEAGLRIAPDQWSALLYGDTAHKSHMQSINDKLQNPQSFAQSVQELVIALQRTGDPGNLCVLRPRLEYLANVDVNHNFGGQIWPAVSTALEAALTVVSGLVNFIKKHGCRKTNTDSSNNIAVHASKYKISLCRDLTMNGMCPRGINCTFAHSEEELMKYRSKHRKYQRKDNENIIYSKFSGMNSVSKEQGVDSHVEKCSHMRSRNAGADDLNCFFCKTGDYNAEYNDSTFVPFNDIIYPNRVITTPSLPLNNPRKITSSQYLLAMNQRKQQIISELQQVLSGDMGQSSSVFNSSSPESSYLMKGPSPQGSFRAGVPVSNHSSGLFAPVVAEDKLNLQYGTYSTIPDWNFLDLRRQTPFSNDHTMISPQKEQFYTAADDWNINCSKLYNMAVPKEDIQQNNASSIPSDDHESLLLESVKLQDQLRGLKKQITDIKDETYEEGIVNDLRALELRLECELAEEEKKLWPVDSKI